MSRRGLGIGAKLALMVGLPLLGLLMLAAVVVVERVRTYQAMSSLETLSSFAVTASANVHELQRERGMTGLFIGSAGKTYEPELAVQRLESDKRLPALRAAVATLDETRYGEGFGKTARAAVAKLDKLAAHRASADGLKLSSAEAIAYYTEINAGLIDAVAELTHVSTDAQTSELLVSYVDLMQAKERAGLERAMLSNVLAADKFGDEAFVSFTSNVSAQDVYTRAFLLAATPAQRAFYEATVRGPAVDEVVATRKLAIERARQESLGKLDAPRWFDTATQRITLLKTVEDRLAADVLAKAQQLRGDALQTLLVLGSLAAVALLVGVGVAFKVSRDTTRSVRRVAAAARGLALGELDQQIDVTSGDEVGQMAAAFREMIAYQQEMAGVAAAVARGDLTRHVAPKSERDTLGVAFRDMTEGLRDLVGQVKSSAVALAAASEQLGTATEQTSVAVSQVSRAMENVAAGSQDASRSAENTSAAVGQLTQAIDAIAQGAQEQARQAQATSATVTQMAAGVEQVAADAKSVATASARTRTAAEQGAQAVRDTVAGMAEIKLAVGQASETVEELGRLGEQIGTVVETIDDIAEQTNLLALNAAIEAARAGEQGRGFAVVADEVRKLAERSQRETKAIADLIRQVQAGTRGAVGAMQTGAVKVEQGAVRADQAGRTLAEILAAVDTTVEQVTGIAAAAQQMAVGARTATDAIGAIGAVIEESSAATEEMAAQAEQVRAAADSIAAVSTENGAATEEVSASAQEMAAQVEEMGAQAQELAATAERLRELVAQFTVDATAPSPAAPVTAPTPRMTVTQLRQLVRA